MFLKNKIEELNSSGKIEKFDIFYEIITLCQKNESNKIYTYFDKLIIHIQDYIDYDSKPIERVKQNVGKSFCSLFLFIKNENSRDMFYQYFDIFQKYVYLIEDFLYLAKIYQCFGFIFWMDQNIKKSIYYLQKSLELINQTDLNEISGRYTNLGYVYEYSGDYKTAEDYYFQGIKFAQENHYHEALFKGYNALGRLYYHLEYYAKAQKYFQIALDLKGNEPDNADSIRTIMNLASTHVFLENYDKAIECMESIVQDWLKEKDPELYYSAITNMAIYYKELGDFKNSEKFNDIVKIYASENNNLELLFACYYNKSLLAMEKKDFQNAIDFGSNALKISKKNQNPKQILLALKVLGIAHKNSENYHKAIDFLKKSEKIARKNNDEIELTTILELIADCLYKINDFENAYIALNENRLLAEKAQQGKNEDNLSLDNDRIVKCGNCSQFIFNSGYSLISKELNEKIAIPLIGQSPIMKKVVQQALIVANSNANVLIKGESGTGKELFARMIHFSSDRQNAPFVPVNSASFAAGLAQSALFGHEKGAFTGAVNLHQGFFEQAHTGSIFLDEISEMPMDIQTSLLRVLEDKNIRRLGSKKLIISDFRLITATNRDINEMLKDKVFRHDLLNRINTLEIEIPPLRERLDDIPLFIDYYLKSISQKLGKNIPEMEASVISFLLEYNYPGNVREFINILEKLVIFCKNDFIKENDLEYLNLQKKTENINLSPQNLNLKENEEMLINSAMKTAGNSQKKAAVLLGIPDYTLSRKLKKMKSGDYKYSP